MTYTKYEVRPGVYYDSVVLMQLQKSLAELPRIIDAGAVMATTANRDLLNAAGFDITGLNAKADDLLIAVMGEDESAAQAAIDQIDALVRRRGTKTGSDFRPHSLKGALDILPESKWTLISVPGRYAAAVAREALQLGQHVFLYSDNVPLADEVGLKEEARLKGLLFMGPDCGTAVINGAGLGFANRVRRGAIGLVAASGTGLQAVTAGIHNLGGGVSQAIGTGGRDLRLEVGGSTTLQALDLLHRDPRTEVIVLISKPIDPAIGIDIVSAAQATTKPTVVHFIGYPLSLRRLGNLHFVSTLNEAAEMAVNLLAREDNNESEAAPDGAVKYIRGLFSGGTLAYEALLGLQTFVSPLYSNIPLRAEQKLASNLISQAHTIIDLGEDEFTQGRLHPMMDNDLRLRRMVQEAEDPEVGVLLLDVVLGEGAHPNPAAELAPVIADIKAGRDIDVVVIVLGTDEDPQGLHDQIAHLVQAGASVVRTVSEAVIVVNTLLRRPFTYQDSPLSLDDFGDDFAAVNVGLESFYNSLKEQGASAVHVDWRPPAGGKENLMAILAKLKDS